MNKYLRQLFTAVIALFVVLGLSSTIIMAISSSTLNNDSRNARALYHQLGAYRGAILASDGTVMAQSEPVNDAFKYQRTYSNGPLYAPVTGFFSINQTADRGLEASRSMLLSGEADSLIWQRAKAMLTGSTNQGASIETSINPQDPAGRVRPARHQGRRRRGHRGENRPHPCHGEHPQLRSEPAGHP